MKAERVNWVEDFRRAARRRLPRIIFDYIEGGAGDERAVADSLDQFSDYRLVPRYLIDARTRCQTAAVFAHRFDSPFGVSPMGYAGVYYPKAEEIIARSCAAANIPMILSGFGVASLESIAEIAGANVWFQLYAARNLEVSLDLIHRAAAAGVETLVVTVDIPAQALRYRNARHGFSVPPQITPSLIFDVARHPRWLMGYLRNGGLQPAGSWVAYAPKGAGPREVAAVMMRNARSPQTWEHIAAYREAWNGNLVIKGILHPDDALRAAEHGVNGIIVSSHGGRQFDRSPTPIEMLPAIVKAAGDRLSIMLDGGIARGVDIMIAYALGADFVFTGRSALWGLTAAGRPGLERVITLLRDEIDDGLAQTGALTMEGVRTLTVIRDGARAFSEPKT